MCVCYSIIQQKKRLSIGRQPRTEDEPGLTELQVNAEVCLETDLGEGDISIRVPSQRAELPVTVPDTWEGGGGAGEKDVKREEEINN